MKKILILGISLTVGGVEKSLVNFLNMIDPEQYEVDFLLFQKRGAFLSQVPQSVHIVEEPTVHALFQTASETFANGFSLRALGLLLVRYLTTAVERLRWKQFDRIRLHRWLDSYGKLIPSCSKEYDLAVAYAGGETAYYMLDKVKAKRKVYFFHSDYSKIDIDADLERQYVDRADAVCAISETCRQSLVNLFPEKEKDIFVLENLSSAKLIRTLANAYTAEEFSDAEGKLKIVSIGRIHPIKGFDLAVEAAKILKEQEIPFRWIAVGDGEDRKLLQERVQKYGMKEDFLFVGQKENPYPYLSAADVLVQPSRFEGKSVVLDEAKILGIPMIITDYPSASDQICSGRDGLIVELSPEGIADGIGQCARDRSLLLRWKNGIEIPAKMEDAEGYMRALFGETHQ